MHEVSADFEDDRGSLNKEARYRRHTLKIFNRRREDFPSEHDYDNYLEEVEDIVFNLANDIDVDETKARVESYRRKNQDLIGQNQALRSEDERKAAETLARSERERVAKLSALRKCDAEREEEARRIRRELEREELQRASLGKEEAARLKRKKDRRLEKKQRALQKQAADEANLRLKAALVDTKPMFCRPAFPNPPPCAVEDESLQLGLKVSGSTRGIAGGWLESTELQRALLEFSEALRFEADT